MKTVDDYVDKYGFCNWQAQELLKRLTIAEKALMCSVMLAKKRKEELGDLSPEYESVLEECEEALKVLNEN